VPSMAEHVKALSSLYRRLLAQRALVGPPGSEDPRSRLRVPDAIG
jgi:hypothetical protein